MARECHLQNPASSLIFQVSSSGGGLPGRLDLERDSRRSLFWADISQMDSRSFLRSQESGLRRIWDRSSVGGDREVDGNLGFGFDWLAAFEVRFEVPLPDGVLGS